MKFLIVLILLTYSNGQYIVDSSPLLEIVEKIRRDFSSISQAGKYMDLQLSTNTTYYDIINYNDPKYTMNVTIISIVYNSLSLLIDRLDISFTKEGNTQISGRSGSFIIKFKFKYSLNTSPLMDADLNLDIGNFTIVISPGLSSVSLGIYKIGSLYQVLNVNDELSKKTLANALIAKFDSESFINIFDSIRRGIGIYYENELAIINPVVIQTQYPVQDIIINMNKYVGICGVQSETIVCPYSGNINLVKTKILSDALIEALIKDTNQYKVFLHYDIFNQIFSRLVDNNSFIFDLNNSNKPNNLPYNLDIQSMGNIFNDLYNDFPRGLPVLFKNIIKSITLNNGKGLFNLITSAFIDESSLDKKIFELNIEVNFIINIPFTAARLNFCINDLKINNIEIVIGPSTSYMNKLKTWILITFKNYLSVNKYCISGADLNINNYFKYITSVIQGANGFYIIGKSIYL